MHKTGRVLWALVFVLAIPAAVRAQSSITGVVRDTSGAVLPGVTVEAASDVLIEKVRSVVTDGSGQYRIVDLRPGIYTVTFTLPGFSLYKREGLELSAEFVATVNADLRVGTLEETVTVTGESPIVDVQSAKRQRTLDSDLVQSLPTARGYAGLMVLIPSMVQSGGGNPNVQLSPGMVVFGGRGGRGNEGRAQVDGLNTGASLNGGGVSGYRQDVENAQEVAITTAGGMGETEIGGPTINIIPRTGGNTLQGALLLHRPEGRHAGEQLHRSELRPPGCARQRRRNYHLRHELTRSAARSSRIGCGSTRLGVLPRQRERRPGHVLQQERRRHHQWTYEADPSRPAVSGGTRPDSAERCG